MDAIIFWYILIDLYYRALLYFLGHTSPSFNQCARNISIHVALAVYMQQWDHGS